MSKTQEDYTIPNRCLFIIVRIPEKVVLRKNKFQFLPILVLLWLTIAIWKSRTPLKGNNQCTGSPGTG